MTWGQLLRRYRQRARLTQEELAERSGYSANYLSKLERDQRQAPPDVDAIYDPIRGAGGVEDSNRRPGLPE